MIYRQGIGIILAIVALLITACNPQVVTVVVTRAPETVVVTQTPLPSPTAPPPEPKVLDVCLIGEPDTLYLYGDSRIAATKHVMQALYDGPIDHRNYAYQPVILKKLPSIVDGDAITRAVRVREGEPIVDVSGEVVDLAEGVLLRPLGCHSDECAIEFTPETEMVKMELMETTFTLREDVTWSDGEPLTATDSVFAFEVASAPVTPGSSYLVQRTISYRALDDYRVKWVGLPGFIDETYMANFFPPLPRHQLEDQSPAALLRADETRRFPMGWGPFVIAEWVQGERIVLSRNPNYFRASEGLPYLDRVVFKFTTDASEMTAKLMAGECDIGVHDADFSDLMTMLDQAEDSGLLNVISAPGNGWEHIDFGIAPVSDYERADFFGDVRVRRAIAQCVDRQAIVDEATYGRSVVTDSYLPPGHPLYAGDALTHWEYDPAAGRALLEEVGWLESENGVRAAQDVEGVRDDTLFEVILLTSEDSPVSQQVARIVKAQLADCGIRVNLESRPAWELFADGPEGPFFGRRFDMVETAWWFNALPPCGHYLSSETPDDGQWHGDNPSGYSDPQYDNACRSALQELPGSSDYEEYHKRAQVIFSEDIPALPLFMRLRIAVARPNVLGLTMNATSASELWNIEVLDLIDE